METESKDKLTVHQLQVKHNPCITPLQVKHHHKKPNLKFKHNRRIHPKVSKRSVCVCVCVCLSVSITTIYGHIRLFPEMSEALDAPKALDTTEEASSVPPENPNSNALQEVTVGAPTSSASNTEIRS